MKLLDCPLNGPRNIQEFVCDGEVRTMPNADTCTDEEWAEFVFIEENRKGIVREWWCHIPSSFWFIAERDTATDEFLRTYSVEELFGIPKSSAGD